MVSKLFTCFFFFPIALLEKERKKELEIEENLKKLLSEAIINTRQHEAFLNILLVR